MDPFQRSALISNFNKIVKEHKNQTEIVDKAIEILKADTNYSSDTQEVDEDWIMQFIDKSRLVSNEDMQLIWGKILAEEISKPRSISKQLLFIVSQMSKEDAQSFMRLIPYCVDIYEYGEGVFRTQPIIFSTSDKRIHEENRFSYDDMKTLESYGLIKNTVAGIRVFGKGGIEIKYGEKTIYKVDDAYDLIYSNVSLTKAGTELLKITNRMYFDDVLEYIERSLDDNNKIEF